MCYTCLLLYTPHPVITPAVLAAYDHINGQDTTPEQRRASPVLRPIFADWNVDDDLIALLNRLSPRKPGWEWEILDALTPLTEAERITVLAMLAGYVSRTGELREDIRQRSISAPRRLLTTLGKSRAKTPSHHPAQRP